MVNGQVKLVTSDFVEDIFARYNKIIKFFLFFCLLNRIFAYQINKMDLYSKLLIRIMRTNKIFHVLATALLGCFAVAVHTACVNEDNTESKVTHEEKVPDELIGIWSCDADDVDGVDLATFDVEFKKDGKVEMAYNYYDYKGDCYQDFPVNGVYRMLTYETYQNMKVGRIEVTFDQESMERLSDNGSYDQQLVVDTLRFVFQDGVLALLATNEDVEPEQEYMGTVVFQRGDTDESKLNKKMARECIDEFLKYEELGENPEAMSANIGRRAAGKTPGGHNPKTWMNEINNETMVCKMMIPGTHDSGTFGLKNPWMLTIAKTQMDNWKTQFENGIRAFDIRTRYHNTGNFIYHSMIDCAIAFGDALDDIAKVLKDNPNEGLILIIKGEAPDISIGKNKHQRETMNWLGQIAPINYDGTTLDMEATTKETVQMVTEKLLNKGLLAKFKPDMKMGDLRGKALVILENQPDKWAIDDARYGNLRGYIALHRGTTLVATNGEKVDYPEQNEYECPKNMEIKDFAEKKGKAFDEKLSEAVANRDKIYWCYNAANSYKFEMKFIPDYVSCANMVHPKFIESIKKNKGARSIILQDYAGETTLKRVPAGRLLGFAGFSVIGSIPCKIIVGGVKAAVNKVLEWFGSKKRWTHDYITDTSIMASYGAALLATGKTDTHGQELVNTVIDANFNY